MRDQAQLGKYSHANSGYFWHIPLRHLINRCAFYFLASAYHFYYRRTNKTHNAPTENYHYRRENSVNT